MAQKEAEEVKHEQMAFILFGLVGILESHKKTLGDAAELLSAYPQLITNPELLSKSIQRRLHYQGGQDALLKQLEAKAWKRTDEALTEVAAGLKATLGTVQELHTALKAERESDGPQ